MSGPFINISDPVTYLFITEIFGDNEPAGKRKLFIPA